MEDLKIGLEIHIPITSVESKLFCSCRNTSRYKPDRPNQYVCPVCLGLPGALPHPNEKAIYMAIKAAKALKCRLSDVLQFYRKHYFYPDLPKGYQITQYKAGGYAPLGENGLIRLSNSKIVRIRRVQIEEDPAKLIHPGGLGESDRVLIDYNRSGNPLIEVVTEPDITSPREARELLEKLIRLLMDIGVLDRSIEVVIMADANISLKGSARIEIKNIGSPKDVEKALEFEKMRLERYIMEGIETVQETRHWDDRRRVTVSIREKEVEEEYRYIPDPNIPPINITYLIEEVDREEILLEEDIYSKLVNMGVRGGYAEILSRDRGLYTVFIDVIDRLQLWNDKTTIDKAAGLFINEGRRLVKEGLPYKKVGEIIYSVLLMVKEGFLTLDDARRRILKRSTIARKEISRETLMEIINEIYNSVTTFREGVRDYIVGETLKKCEELGYSVNPAEVADIVENMLRKTVEKPRIPRVEKRFIPSPYRESIVKKKLEVKDAFILREGRYMLAGWIESKMIVGRKIFVILRDWSGKIQLVIDKDKDIYEFFKDIPRESFIEVEGILYEDRRAPGGVEVHVERARLLSEAYNPPLTLLDIARSSIPVRLKYRFLDIRRSYMRSILRFRAKLLNVIREYFIKNGFIEINKKKDANFYFFAVNVGFGYVKGIFYRKSKLSKVL